MSVKNVATDKPKIMAMARGFQKAASGPPMKKLGSSRVNRPIQSMLIPSGPDYLDREIESVNE